MYLGGRHLSLATGLEFRRNVVENSIWELLNTLQFVFKWNDIKYVSRNFTWFFAKLKSPFAESGRLWNVTWGSWTWIEPQLILVFWKCACDGW